MEDNIDLDDDDYTKSNELTEDRKNAIKKIMKKIIKEIHQKPYLLRQAMAFKDWKIKSGIKQEQNDENESKIIKKNIKKVKKKKTIKKVKKEEDKETNIEDSNNDKQFLLDNDIINTDTDKTDKNNSGEKTGEKHKVKKVKKIIKKKIIKKKISLPDDSDKISAETNLSNLTSPNLVVKSLKEDFDKTEKNNITEVTPNKEKDISTPNKNEITKSNISIENTSSNKKVIKKKKIIKKKQKKSDDINITDINNDIKDPEKEKKVDIDEKKEKIEDKTEEKLTDKEKENKPKKVKKKIVKVKKLGGEIIQEKMEVSTIQQEKKICSTEPSINNNDENYQLKELEKSKEKPKKKKVIKSGKKKKKNKEDDDDNKIKKEIKDEINDNKSKKEEPINFQIKDNNNKNNIKENNIPNEIKEKEIKINENMDIKETPNKNIPENSNNLQLSKEDLFSKSSQLQYKIDPELKNLDVKVQFAESVSEKKFDFDFYQNKGKDSCLDLNALKDLEKIEFSDDSEEEKKIKKKKKKKKKKIKKENNDGNEKDENKRKYTDEEKKWVKIYERGMHLLRKAIRSYKKRNNKNEYEDRFKLWKNLIFSNIKIISNEIDLNNNQEGIKEKNNEKNFNNDINKVEENKKENINEEKKEEEIKSDINNNINNDLNNNKIYEEENMKDSALKNLNNLVEINYKINNKIVNILKDTEDKQFNELETDIFNKILIENNKKLSVYKLFCLYNYFKENISFCKKYYFKKWKLK